MVSALGSVVLAISVFLPWYGVGLTTNGVSVVEQIGDQFVSQYGNAAAQSYIGGLHERIGALAGQQITSVDGHTAFKNLSIVMLVLAGLALLDALIPLARSDGAVPDGAGRSVVLLGCVAGACVLFRMIVPPNPASSLLSFSTREGAWLALLGSLSMVIGGLWPRYQSSGGASERRQGDIFSALSGWTPQG